jgi:hypothetical protein
MKTPSKPRYLPGAAVLLALIFAAGSLAALVLAVPLPAPLAGLAAVLLALRLGVMAAAIEEPPGATARPARPAASGSKPALHAARG